MNDLILDSDNDLKIVNGDFAIGDNLVQRQQLIIQSAKNDWKQYPEMGVGMDMFLEDEDYASLFAEVREQFRLDGMVLTHIGFDDEGNIHIDGKDS